jgi:hypothetical protein
MDRSTTNLLNFLSLSELETLIQSIVRRILRSELQQLQSNPPQSAQTDTLLATFGTWEDDRPVEAIIDEIYSTRTLNSLEA